jgi:hypothetical protein
MVKLLDKDVGGIGKRHSADNLSALPNHAFNAFSIAS